MATATKTREQRRAELRQMSLTDSGFAEIVRLWHRHYSPTGEVSAGPVGALASDLIEQILDKEFAQ